MTLEILYQDEFIIAVNKPEGLLSVPGRGADKQDSVASRVQAACGDARTVHRLDCHTSGVMLMAIGLDVQRELSRQFHDREIEKEYIALVHGCVSEDQGEIDMPMRCDIDNRPRQIIDYEQGKSALTRWSVIDRYAEATRLLLRPVTGRSHQLRLHCMAMGFPIIGDRLYSSENETANRMMLHARAIVFSHPGNGERVRLGAHCDF